MSTHANDQLGRRPFEGLPAEADLVAMRQLIPSATLPARTTEAHGEIDVVIATVLPMTWPAIRRNDGSVLVGLQASVPGGDLSRAFGQAITQALELEPGNPVTTVEVTDQSPRLQDLLDPESFGPIAVHETFEFWLDPDAERTSEIEQSLQQANDAIMPTAPVPGLPHAYWVDAGAKEHVRWVFDAEEDQVIDAVARLHAKRASGITPEAKYVGSFRAEGLSIPVWDLPQGYGVEGLEGHVDEFRERFEQALANTEPLSILERRARGGIVARQVTLR
jgi:hypothetical protein